MSVKSKIPWWAKIAAKLLLSRLSLSYKLWEQLGLFKHGHMEKPAYAFGVFKEHFDKVEFERKGKGFVALEIGPGDSLFSAMIARAFGASAIYLVDAGNFVRNDLQSYHAMQGLLVEKGLTTPKVENPSSLEQILSRCHAQYKTDGLSSLRTIPDQSVDFIWSQAVLEHVRKSEFYDTILEFRRVLRPDGVCSHRVDLKDHLGGALNNLRFPDQLWESNFMASSGFYTNRIRYSQMLSLYKQAGFDIDVLGVERWNTLPTPRARLAKCFRKFPDEELCISGFDVILRPI